LSNNVLSLTLLLEAIEKVQKYSAGFESADDFFHHEMNFDVSMMQFIVIAE
jgi:hypothetical protein